MAFLLDQVCRYNNEQEASAHLEWFCDLNVRWWPTAFPLPAEPKTNPWTFNLLSHLFETRQQFQCQDTGITRQHGKLPETPDFMQIQGHFRLTISPAFSLVLFQQELCWYFRSQIAPLALFALSLLSRSKAAVLILFWHSKCVHYDNFCIVSDIKTKL